jgi:hypothetical protein
MFAAKLACCSRTGCNSNANRTQVACCSACGKCGADSFHSGCTASSMMRDAIVAACSGDDCLNSTNGVQTLVCAVCGKCGDCSFHSH